MLPTMFTPKLFTLIRQGYRFETLKPDLLAGLTVAIVALPLAMALAIASGASPEKGLITAVVAGFIISFLGGSRVQIGGPTGAFVVVVYNVIGQHGYDGLVLATLLAGLILIIGGYAKLGQVIKFIPHTVVTGFTAGIAVIIASSQVKDFLGLQLDHVPADFIPKWKAYFGAFHTIHLGTLGVGLSSLLAIILMRKYVPKWPSYLIAIAMAAVMVKVLHLPMDTIGSRFPDIPNGLPIPEFPAWNFTKVKEVIPSAFTIAFLAGIEALLSAMVADGMTGYKHRSNQELVGQGVANITSAFFGGLPATGAIARTATNIKAGARTPMSGIFHALFLLVFMMFAMKLMAFIPMAALAAILLIVSWGMSEINHFIHIFRLSSSDRTVMLLTFSLTVLVDLTVAIGVGVTLASLLFMRHMTQTVSIKKQGQTPTPTYDEVETQRKRLPEGVEVFRIAGPVFFGVASDLIDTFKAMGQMPKVLILRMKLVPYLDATGTRAIDHVIKQCKVKGITVILCGLQKQPEEILRNGDIFHGKDGIIVCKNYQRSIQKSQKLINQQPSTAV